MPAEQKAGSSNLPGRTNDFQPVLPPGLPFAIEYYDVLFRAYRGGAPYDDGSVRVTGGGAT
ncbi:protein of unknown function [Candidatus Methylomirabilis oxygeniifera]|uniref:Uncharacterized protein n=1 Tax=Methylomirabilis oxygeniifera TaxID=671143 RepID=D5MMY1_METO1|nr:protein of unknown function [Candidatus Methylomirabilis oxyfera]